MTFIKQKESKGSRSVTSLALALAVLLALSLALAGCSSGEKPAADTPATDKPAADGGGSSSAELPNPIVTVDGPEAFLDQLGIRLEPEPQAQGAVYSIIEAGTQKTASISYSAQIGGANAQVEVRAQKTDAAADISGIYDNFSLNEPGQATGDVVTELHYDEGANGYVNWYNQPAGISGSISVSTGASFETLSELSAFYIQQENLR
jgi:hypothetical protein